LSGGGGLIRGLASAGDGTAADRRRQSALHEDPVFVGSDGGLALALDAPDGDWEKLTP